MRELGRTDIQVSVICQGCWSIVGGFNWGPQDREDSVAAIRTAFDSGINFFDTATAYGDGLSETMLGEVLGDHRHEIVLATKVRRSDLAPADVRASCEGSLRRLRTDYIDLLQIHWPSREVPLADSLAEMDKLRQEGKIRAIGVSNFGRGFLEPAVDSGDIQANQIAYNLLFRGCEEHVQPTCDAHDISLLCYSPILQGILAGKFASADEVPEDRARTRHFSGDRPQAKHGESGCEAEMFAAVDHIARICDDLGEPMAHVALAWLLAQPAVTSVLAGARNAAQAADNAAAGDLVLDESTVAAVSDATEPVKNALGESIDMWQANPSRAER
jgi:aryl-alcohol dehydrogenase-like predicted oxidoreductase